MRKPRHREINLPMMIQLVSGEAGNPGSPGTVFLQWVTDCRIANNSRA